MSIINLFLPKNKNKYFIYDNTFRQDNLWAIKTFLEQDLKNQVYYYVSKRTIEKNCLNSTKYIRYIHNVLTGFYHQCTSKYVFSGYGTYRFTVRTNKRQRILNTWHGTPLKNIGYLKGDTPIFPYNDNFDFILSPSPFFDEIFKKSFGATDKQLLKSGYPRNDKVIENTNYDLFGKNYKKTFLWLPTYRVSMENNLLDSSMGFPILNKVNFISFCAFLISKEILVILKPHPFMNLPSFLKESDNFKIIDNDFMFDNKLNLRALFKISNALITDYSSVIFDYLLLDKPIIFTVEDIEEYGDKRGFVVENPLIIMPGVKINTFKNLKNEIIKVVEDIDLYAQDREKINQFANAYHKESNVEYILNFMINND